MYSPAAIENAPASKPASPAKAIAVLAAPEPAKPITSEVLDTRPSLTPNTAARSAPERSPRCQRSTLLIPLGSSVFRISGNYPGMGTLVGGHRRVRIRVALIPAGVGVFGTLEMGQHRIDGESASQPGQHRGSPGWPFSGGHRLAQL